MNHIVKSIVEEWVKTGVIEESDSPLYYFGLYEGGIFVIEVLVTLVIASIMQSLWVGIIFFLAFFSIRRFSGGFHAETRVRCFIVSVFVVVGAMKGIELLCNCYSFHMVLISGICSVAIGVMSPVENEKRELTTHETMIHKNRLLLILLCELVLSIILAMLEQKMILSCVTMAILVCIFLNVLEVIKRKLYCNSGNATLE